MTGHYGWVQDVRIRKDNIEPHSKEITIIYAYESVALRILAARIKIVSAFVFVRTNSQANKTILITRNFGLTEEIHQAR